MNSPEGGQSLPKAVIKKGRPAWLLWLVPLGALGLCAWFIEHDFISAGPLITIYFKKADGLQPGNTQVQFRGAQVGQVKTVDLTPDHKQVKVTARLAGSAKNLARDGSLFWIVRPELKVGAISGLQTIVSGDYVTVQPGTGAPTNEFTGVEEAPLEERPGALLIAVRANYLGSMQEHSPVLYRGVQVGEVVGYQLASDSRSVRIQMRVRKEYAPLVRANSIFWNAGGVDFHVGLFKGAQMSATSVQSLLSGAIEFATPPKMSEQATNGATFELNEKEKDEWKSWEPNIPLQLSDQAPTSPHPTLQQEQTK
jgi:paraquat-inducible protein B